MQPGHDAFYGNPYDCYRYKYLPAEPHDLVIAIARKCCSQPEENKYKECDLGGQPEEAWLTQEMFRAEESLAFEQGCPAT